VTSGSVAANAAKQATGTIPIVTATGFDHVELGLAASLARPGGNVTGVSSIAQGLTGKRFELLREVLPRLSRLAVIWHADNPGSLLLLRELEEVVRSSKVVLQKFGIKSAEELSGAFTAMTQQRAEAVFVVAGPYFFSQRRRLCRACLAASIAERARTIGIRGSRRFPLLRAELHRFVPSRCGLRGQDPEGAKPQGTCRSSSRPHSNLSSI
jgi:putative ABC transport system substrate-binding protein